jgi:hypothetical protein
MIASDPKMVSYRKLELNEDVVIADAHLGRKAQAIEGLSKIASGSNSSTEDTAQERLIAAEVYLALGLQQSAYDNAVPAQIFFAASGQHDSELRSTLLAAVASKNLNNAEEFSRYSAKTVDIISQLQHTYDPQAFQIYLSRPDLHILRQQALEKAR